MLLSGDGEKRQVTEEDRLVGQAFIPQKDNGTKHQRKDQTVAFKSRKTSAVFSCLHIDKY